MDFAHPSERMRLNQRSEELAARAGDVPKVLRAHLRMAFDAMELGDVTAADHHVGAYQAAVRGLQSPRYAWPGAMLRAMRALFDGRFTDAQACVDEAVTLGRAADDRRVSSSLVFHRIVEHRTAERHPELITASKRAGAMLTSMGDGELFGPLLLASAHVRAEREEDAREAWARVHKLPGVVLTDRSGLTMTGEVAAYIGDEPRCRTLLERALAYDGLFVSWGIAGFACEGPVARLIGLLREALGEPERADDAFASAIAAAEGAGALPQAIRTRYEWTRARLARAGHAGDPELRRALEGVEEDARARGMDGLAELAARRLLQIAQPAMPAAAPAMPAASAASAASAAPAAGGEAVSIVCEGEVFALRWAGVTVRIRDSRGTRILEQLASRPGVEVHVLDLVETAGEESAVVDLGDSGEILDRRALDEYRAEIVRLEAAAEQAEQLGNAPVAAEARAQVLFLARELSGAVGLGGRTKRTGQNAERARVAVQRRVRDAVGKVAAQSSALGQHLAQSVRTGMFCVYAPRG
jgi:hypothetical protein